MRAYKKKKSTPKKQHMPNWCFFRTSLSMLLQGICKPISQLCNICSIRCVHAHPTAAPRCWGVTGAWAPGDSEAPQQPPRNTWQTLFLRLGLTLRSGWSFHQVCPTADLGLGTAVTARNLLQSINICDWEKGLVQTDRLPWHRFYGIHSDLYPTVDWQQSRGLCGFCSFDCLKKECTPSFLRRQLTHFKISF